jgi:threonine/homoserine/homoserine lactone efflux protein
VGFKATLVDAEPQSLSRGAMVNALSPHPYLFWITVGAPTILKGWTESPLLSVVFVASFFWCLVGSKVVLAVLAGKSRRFLIGKSYIYIMRLLGLALFAFALVLFRDGLSLLK